MGLFLCLKDSITGLSVLRNEPLPTKVPAEGLLILRDGDPGEPEVTLSPTRYHYQHRAEIEALVQHGDQAQRDTALDALLETVAQALDGQTNLGGLVDYLYIETPDFLSETVEGAPTIKAAVVPVILEYSTSNPLN
ncbi:MAG: acyl-CoA transferase [Alphaproteobacteria bacterium]|nr:acyl-CoA transferase [Alphaproteobacteria bacterium]